MQNCNKKKCGKGLLWLPGERKSGCGGKHIEELSTGKGISNLTKTILKTILRCFWQYFQLSVEISCFVCVSDVESDEKIILLESDVRFLR